MLGASQEKLLGFARDASGNVALLFALTLIPLLIGVGVAVDYGRALIVHERMQDAADAAGLAIGSWVGLSQDDMKIKAQQYFDANYPATTIGTVGTLNVAFAGSDIKVSVSGQVPTTFMQLANINTVDVGASTTIAVGMGTVEVALALDNSGSMAGSKISSLRTAASDLVDTLFASAQNSPKPDPIKIAVVPFAASVNVDPQNKDASWMDADGAGKYNAYETECFANGGTLNSTGVCSVSLSAPAVATNNFALFSSLKDSDGDPIAWAGCVEARPAPYDTTDDAPGGATTLFVPMFTPDEPDNWTCSTSNCAYAGSTNSKRVYNGAPGGSRNYNNYLPDAGTPATCAPEFPTMSSVNTSTDVITTSASAAPSNNMPVVFQSTGGLPGGLSSGTTYYVRSQSGKTFKVSTSSGGSAVNITSGGSGTIRYALAANWTCQSGDANCFGTNMGKSEESGFGGINVGATTAAGALCKYGTPTNKATITSIKVSNYDGGPNFLCTTKPVLPLSTDKATVKAKISEMGAKGMTSIGEGAAWGWRTLSPGAPFTEGRPYDTEENQKVLVLMTDGQNTFPLGSSTGKFLKSQYGMYGYVARGALGTTSTNSSTLTAAMDTRTLQTCNNMKAAGVIIYTVAFQIPSDEADALTLLESCASDSDKYFAPNTESELLNAFNAIGKDISMLRISQ
jgi:Flp pilus assembly protein TadG